MPTPDATDTARTYAGRRRASRQNPMPSVVPRRDFGYHNRAIIDAGLLASLQETRDAGHD